MLAELRERVKPGDAVGLDPAKNFYPNDRPVPVADPKAAAIDEILA